VEGPTRPYGQPSAEHCSKADEAIIHGASGTNYSCLHIIKQYETNMLQDDPVAVKTITDLRFMAKIFARQRRVNELHDLWVEPSKTVKVVIERHQNDVQSMMVQHLWEQNDWPLLEKHCVGIIEDTLDKVYHAGGSNSRFWELCAWRWDIWAGLLAAVNAQYPEQK
jgi:hypothetical protein